MAKHDDVQEYIRPTGKEIITPEDGCRALIAAILHLSLRDAPKNSWIGKDACRFIDSEWCVELCEGIDVDYRTYVKAVVQNSDGKLYLT